MESSRNSLSARLRAGDHAAAEELVDKYYKRIYLFLRRLGHSRQVSEDLTQETFLQAWRHLGRLRDSKAAGVWLYSIACNASRLYWRRHKAAARYEAIERVDSQSLGKDAVEHLEQLNRVKNAVSLLPPKLREAIVLHYLEQLTIAESARAAQVTKGTLKSRLSRALKLLKKYTQDKKAKVE